MNNLYYVVNWENDKQKAWSGTKYGLYKALSKLYRLNTLELTNPSSSIVIKIIKYFFCHKNDFGIKEILYNRNKIVKSLKKEKSTFFQFSEIILDTDLFSTYIYQDLSVSYVKYLYEKEKDIFEYSGFLNNSKKAIYSRFNMQESYYKNCKVIFTMGKWLEKYLVEDCGFPKNKIYHVGGGINVDKNLINPQNKAGNKILFVGRDFKRKGGHLVYEAFRSLKKNIPNLELYVAGPNNDPIESPINGYHYLGDCTHKELSDLYNRCDIFCMPSYFEAYGLVFIEALTYGLPCIGRNCYEMPYFIKDNETGFLLKHDDVSELSSLIIKLLKNDKIKNNVLEKRDWYIKEYSWETVANRIYNIINKN